MPSATEVDVYPHISPPTWMGLLTARVFTWLAAVSLFPSLSRPPRHHVQVLNLFGGVLDAKLEAEKHLRESPLSWTIIRPSGLSSDAPDDVGGPLLLRPEDTLFGLETDPGTLVSRDLVAAAAVQALLQPGAHNRVVEIVQASDRSVKGADPESWYS